MWFRKSCFCRKNVEWNVPGSYRVSHPVRKRNGELLERVAREAATCETAQKCGSHALAFEQKLNAVAFRLQSRHGGGGGLGRDRAPAQVGSDRGIAISAPRQQLGATCREAGVVDEPGPLEGRDRVLAGGGGMTRPQQPLLERLARAVARGEGPRGRGERSRPPHLSPQFPRGRPVQLTPDGEPRPPDAVHRQT